MKLSKYPSAILVALLLFCVALRFVSLGTLALSDPSEGRYATIGQNMFLSGDWITPRTFVAGQLTPFLGKPPLQFWLTATSFQLLGMSEFSSRIPSFLSIVLLGTALWYFAARLFSSPIAFLSAFIFVSSVIVFFFSGSCMIDPLLSATVGGSVIAFGLAASEQSERRARVWGYLFFCLLAAGLMTKGPIAVLLIGMTAGPWSLLRRDFSWMKRLPWLGGLSLVFLLILPWYILVERENPGFLKYFLVNENFGRFLMRDYGDRYGSSHIRARGMVWLMMFGAFAPWSLFIPFALWRARTRNFRAALGRYSWFSYALFWGLAPLLFFSLGRQVSFAYVFPGMPGLALALAVALQTMMKDQDFALSARFFDRTGLLVTSVAAIALVVMLFISPSLLVFLGGVTAFSIFLALCILCRATKSLDPSLSSVALASTAIVTAFTAANVSFRQQIDSAVSSKSLIEELRPEEGEGDERASFLNKVPHSAYFYLQEGGRSTDLIGLMPTPGVLSDGDLIATNKQWSQMPQAERDALQVEGRVDDWVILERRTGH